VQSEGKEALYLASLAMQPSLDAHLAALSVVENKRKEIRAEVEAAYQALGTSVIMRLRRPVSHLPLMRWHWAVEKILSGRAVLSNMSARMLRRTFAHLHLTAGVHATRRELALRTELAGALPTEELGRYALDMRPTNLQDRVEELRGQLEVEEKRVEDLDVQPVPEDVRQQRRLRKRKAALQRAVGKLEESIGDVQQELRGLLSNNHKARRSKVGSIAFDSIPLPEGNGLACALSHI
jgi:hypothetical protein